MWGKFKYECCELAGMLNKLIRKYEIDYIHAVLSRLTSVPRLTRRAPTFLIAESTQRKVNIKKAIAVFFCGPLRFASRSFAKAGAFPLRALRLKSSLAL